MASQNSFSFSRLGLLIKKQWFDNARLYMLSMLALTGILVIVFIFWFTFNGTKRFDEQDTLAIYGVFLFIIGLIFASTTFNALSESAKGTYWLTVPATHMEKLSSGLFYGVIAFPLVYTMIFILVRHLVFFSILLDPDHYINYQNNIGEFIKYVTIIFVPLQILFVLGSAYFKRYAFIKTVLVLLVVVFVYSFLFQVVTKELFDRGNGTHMRNLTSVAIYESQETRVFQLHPSVNQFIELLLQYIWAPVLLIATYFRLKEKEL